LEIGICICIAFALEKIGFSCGSKLSLKLETFQENHYSIHQKNCTEKPATSGEIDQPLARKNELVSCKNMIDRGNKERGKVKFAGWRFSKYTRSAVGDIWQFVECAQW
jgi:hypothetical protein